MLSLRQRGNPALSYYGIAGVFLPLAGTLVAVLLAIFHGGVSATAILLFGGFYLVSSLGLELGFHRLFTHRSFCCGPRVRLMLGLAGSMACEGSVFIWASTHRRHHRFVDTPRDPHSPLPIGWRAFWWSHIGWMLKEAPAPNSIKDLSDDPIARLIDSAVLISIGFGFLVPAVIGGAVGGWFGALEGLLWGGFVRIALCHQSTWCLNSLAHLSGRRPYATPDGSRNVWFLALPTMGAAWHNNHHAFPYSATNDHRWWQVDPSAYVLRLLVMTGLAWNVRTISARSK